MARILGAVATSHVPAIGGALARGDQEEPYWKPFFDGFKPVRAWLDEVKPDVAVVFYNDHGLNFFLDKMPTFAIGAARQYVNEDEGWGIASLPPIPGIPELSWAIIERLVASDFDVTTCQEMLVDQAESKGFNKGLAKGLSKGMPAKHSEAPPAKIPPAKHPKSPPAKHV